MILIITVRLFARPFALLIQAAQIGVASMAQLDLTDKIERLDALEERAGVLLHGLSAFLEASGNENLGLNVAGEMRSRHGSRLKQDVTLVIAVYDSSDRVVET